AGAARNQGTGAGRVSASGPQRRRLRSASASRRGRGGPGPGPTARPAASARESRPWRSRDHSYGRSQMLGLLARGCLLVICRLAVRNALILRGGLIIGTGLIIGDCLPGRDGRRCCGWLGGRLDARLVLLPAPVAPAGPLSPDDHAEDRPAGD